MEWKQKTDLGNNKYSIPSNWLNLEYFEALNTLFRTENALRVFVYMILKSEFNEKWVDLSLINDDDKQTTIGSLAKRRLAQDKNYAYLGYILSSSPLVHLTSGELIRIITSDSYWQHFKAYFQGSKEIIKTKLDEIGNVRNSLAHFRPIKKEDIDLVKSNSIHLFSTMENQIVQFINCPDFVPSNTDDKWYIALSKINSDHCSLSFSQSNDENWVSIKLTTKLDYWDARGQRGYQVYTVPNIKTDKLLLSYPLLTNKIVSAAESNPSVFVSIENPNFEKSIQFTISKSKLQRDFTFLSKELNKIVKQIEAELELISQDRLARGKMIELVKPLYSGEEKASSLFLKNSPFVTLLNENTPVEFWGEMTWTGDNFITSTDIYPWIQASIAKEDLPF